MAKIARNTRSYKANRTAQPPRTGGDTTCKAGHTHHQTPMAAHLCNQGRAPARETPFVCSAGHAHRTQEAWNRCLGARFGYAAERRAGGVCGHFHRGYRSAERCSCADDGFVVVATRSRALGMVGPGNFAWVDRQTAERWAVCGDAWACAEVHAGIAPRPTLFFETAPAKAATVKARRSRRPAERRAAA